MGSGLLSLVGRLSLSQRLIYNSITKVSIIVLISEGPLSEVLLYYDLILTGMGLLLVNFTPMELTQCEDELHIISLFVL